jgi:NAD(P)H-dependent flavin oxidoreductase YrpB (nitropropane dioxygenase family)
MLKSAWQMKKSNNLGLGQTMMAANAPMMIQEAMVKGHPDKGILPSGQVAGAITDLPPAGEVVVAIATQAEETLARLAGLQSGN